MPRRSATGSATMQAMGPAMGSATGSATRQAMGSAMGSAERCCPCPAVARWAIARSRAESDVPSMNRLSKSPSESLSVTCAGLHGRSSGLVKVGPEPEPAAEPASESAPPVPSPRRVASSANSPSTVGAIGVAAAAAAALTSPRLMCLQLGGQVGGEKLRREPCGPARMLRSMPLAKETRSTTLQSESSSTSLACGPPQHGRPCCWCVSSSSSSPESHSSSAQQSTESTPVAQCPSEMARSMVPLTSSCTEITAATPLVITLDTMQLAAWWTAVAWRSSSSSNRWSLRLNLAPGLPPLHVLPPPLLRQPRGLSTW